MPVPFGAFIVPTSSMSPTIKPGDIVIVYGKRVKLGDIVVWCDKPLHCIVHRVVAMGDGYIVTKGDANPVPDKPVPIRYVKGRVAAVIPRWAWALAVLVIGVIAIRNTGTRLNVLLQYIGFSEEAIAIALFAVYALVSALALVFHTSISSPTLHTLGDISQPALLLTDTRFNNSDCSIVIKYMSINGLYIEEVTDIAIEGYKARGHRLSNNTVVVSLPEALQERIALKKRPLLAMRLRARLAFGGMLYGSYKVLIYYHDLELRIINHTLYMHNPNCYPIPVQVVLKYSEKPGEPWSKKTMHVQIRGNSSWIIKPPVIRGYVYADIKYRLFTINRSIQVRLLP